MKILNIKFDKVGHGNIIFAHKPLDPKFDDLSNGGGPGIFTRKYFYQRLLAYVAARENFKFI